jgi:hypothetical protein
MQYTDQITHRRAASDEPSETAHWHMQCTDQITHRRAASDQPSETAPLQISFVFLFEHLAARLINSQVLAVDRELVQSDHICLSCGKAMRLARTIPASGAIPERLTYDCNACGIVFSENMGVPEWRQS